jgi:hypothetical protein
MIRRRRATQLGVGDVVPGDAAAPEHLDRCLVGHGTIAVVWSRRALALVIIANGCVRTEHRDAVAPTPTDVYAVSGIVIAADIVGTPVTDARVAVLDGENLIGTGVSDSNGRFTVNAFRKSDAPPQSVQLAPAAAVAYRYHQRWRAQLVVEAAGCESERIFVAVRRPISADPIAVSLRR